MVHSGSRALGPAIRDHHLRRAEPVGSGLRALDANTVEGRDYLNDAMLARSYAAANRHHIAASIGAVMASRLNATLQWEFAILSDHNHVASEMHFGRSLWVHRKGAMTAAIGAVGRAARFNGSGELSCAG